jgi:hypothetical protein
MTPARDALIAAREWIAGERQAYIEDCTLADENGEPDMESMDDLSAPFLRNYYDPILALIDAALLAEGWGQSHVPG